MFFWGPSAAHQGSPHTPPRIVGTSLPFHNPAPPRNIVRMPQGVLGIRKDSLPTLSGISHCGAQLASHMTPFDECGAFSHDSEGQRNRLHSCRVSPMGVMNPPPIPQLSPPPCFNANRFFTPQPVVFQRGMSPSPIPSTSAPIPLRNFGNTCYMNATLQCILHSPDLLHSLAQTHPRARWRPTAAALLEFTMNASRNSDQLLIIFKKEVARLNEEFIGNGQSDAHEFLRTFLFLVHSETNRVSSGTVQYREIPTVDGEDEVSAMKRWREYLLSVDDSVVYDLFGGIMCSKCICSSCHNVSLTFDPFLDLSLPMPPNAMHPNMIESMINVNFNEAVENLCGTYQLPCTKCRRRRNGVRVIKIAQWPRNLVLHLKRFENKGYKNSLPVVFPESFVTCGDNPVHYLLYGLICHSGTENWGHYTSYVFVQNGGWYLCNDSNIVPVPLMKVVQMITEAYILFYAADS